MMPGTVVRSLASTQAALVLFAVGSFDHSAAAVAPATAFVSPGGAGTCTATAPCGSIELALRRVGAGGTILIASGSYPTQVIHDTGGRTAHFATNVVVEPAPGANPVLSSIVDYAPHLTFSHLRVDATSSGFSNGYGGVDIKSGANYSQLVTSRLTNATLVLQAANVAAIGNEIGPSYNYDGIDVANGANGVLISRNYIHDLLVGVSNPNHVHVDCLQIYDSSNVTVVSNRFVNCSDRDLIFSPGQRWGVTNVTVVNNFMRGCVTTPCQGSGYAVDARTAPGTWNLTNLAFVSNTVVDGSTLIAANDPGLIFRDNMIGFLGNCMNRGDHNLIAAYNRGLCKDPAFLGATNQVGALPNFVNRTTGDFHLTQADSRLRFALKTAEPGTDFDGLTRCQPSYVGAHDFCAHTLALGTGQKPVAPKQTRAAPAAPSRKATTPKPRGLPLVATTPSPGSDRSALWILLCGLLAVTVSMAASFAMRRGHWPWANTDVGGEGSDITR